MIDESKTSWNTIKKGISDYWKDKKSAYIKNEANFSWIMSDDQKFIKHPTVEINYGIPLQVTGDPEKANLFLCLFNPSVDDGKDRKSVV